MAKQNDALNYEAEMLDPKPEKFQFHGDDRGLAIDHILHYMGHQGFTRGRIRKIGNIRWIPVDLNMR